MVSEWMVDTCVGKTPWWIPRSLCYGGWETGCIPCGFEDEADDDYDFEDDFDDYDDYDDYDDWSAIQDDRLVMLGKLRS